MSDSFPAMAGSAMKRRDALRCIGGAVGLATVIGVTAADGDDPLEGATIYVGSSDETLYAVDAATGEQVWVFTEPSDRIRSSPVVVDGAVYFGCHDGTLYAVDAATGEREWAYRYGGTVHTPTVVDGTVYFHAAETGLGAPGSVLALDAATGEEEWEHRDSGLGLHARAPLVVDGTVYTVTFATTGPSWVDAFDAETGEQLWTYEETFGYLTKPPTSHDGAVIATGTETILALDGETGDERWKEFFARRWPGLPSTGGATVYGDTVYHGVNDRLFARDATTGERFPWFDLRLPDEEQVVTAPTVDCPHVYFGTDEAFYAADTLTGEIEWRFAGRAGLSSPTAFGSTVFVGSGDGELVAIDASEGEPRWVFDEPESSVHSSPTIVADPTDGHSVGSRFRHATLNHHDRAIEPTPPTVEIDSLFLLDTNRFPLTEAWVDVPAELGRVDSTGNIRVSADDADAFEDVDVAWLGIRIRNTGDEPGTRTVELRLDGEVVGRTELAIEGCLRSGLLFGGSESDLPADEELTETILESGTFVEVDGYGLTGGEFEIDTGDDSRTIVVESLATAEDDEPAAGETDTDGTADGSRTDASNDDGGPAGSSGDADGDAAVIGSDLPGFDVASAVAGLGTAAFLLGRRLTDGERR